VSNKRLNIYVLAMLIELLWFQKVSAQSWFLCSRNTSPLYSILKHGSWSGHAPDHVILLRNTDCTPSTSSDNSLWGILKKNIINLNVSKKRF